jgi:hypothetical protein
VQPWESSSSAHPLPCSLPARLSACAMFPLVLCSPPPLSCVLCSARSAARRQGTDLRLHRSRRGAAASAPTGIGGRPLHLLPRELGNDKDQAEAPPSLSIPVVVSTATTLGSWNSRSASSKGHWASGTPPLFFLRIRGTPPRQERGQREVRGIGQLIELGVNAVHGAAGGG